MQKFINIRLSMSHVELLLKILRANRHGLPIARFQQLVRLINKVEDAQTKGDK